MKFCPKDGCLLNIVTKNVSLSFKCPVCNESFDGVAEDTLISSGTITYTKDDIKYKMLIDNSPFDKTNKLVKKKM